LRPTPLVGIADDPAHRVAGGDGAGADELLAFCRAMSVICPDCGIDLIERARP
jgi:hypothetical protein